MAEVNPQTVIAKLAAHCWEVTNPATDKSLRKARWCAPWQCQVFTFGAISNRKNGKGIKDVAESMTPEDFCNASSKAAHVASAIEPMKRATPIAFITGDTPSES